MRSIESRISKIEQATAKRHRMTLIGVCFITYRADKGIYEIRLTNTNVANGNFHDSAEQCFSAKTESELVKIFYEYLSANFRTEEIERFRIFSGAEMLEE